MNDQKALEIISKVIGQIFGYQNPYNLEQVRQKFAFDVRLPSKVFDTKTGEETWAQSTNPTKFVTLSNSLKEVKQSDWMREKQDLNTLEDILVAWNEINYTTTERQIECVNIAKSDNIYNSENVYQSQDVHFSKNIAFCDTLRHGEYVVASQRSYGCVYSMRIEDSKECTKSFGVSWSGKISNSYMIHDCYDVADSMFCSHISSKRFCIANMQYTEEEYIKIREMVIKWILS